MSRPQILPASYKTLQDSPRLSKLILLHSCLQLRFSSPLFLPSARANAATSFKPNSAIATRSENRSWMPAKRSEVCRDFLRNSCRRDENSCRFIHLALTDLEARGHQQEWQELGQQAHKVRSMNNGAQVLRISGSNGCEERKVEVCIDFMKGRCQRSGQKCR